MMLGPRLIELSLHLEDSFRGPLHQMNAGLLCDHIRAHATSLQSLDLGITGKQFLEGKLTRMLVETTSIGVLSLRGDGCSDVNLVHAITTLPNLATLRLPKYLHLPTLDQSKLHSLEVPALPSLMSLKAGGAAVLQLAPLLHDVHSLQAIHVQAAADCGMSFWSRSVLESSIFAIATQFCQLLTTVELQLGERDRPRNTKTLLITPLLSCPNLTRIAVEGWLCDCDVEELVSVRLWARLKSLTWDSVDGGSVPSRALLALSEFCPELITLRVPVTVSPDSAECWTTSIAKRWMFMSHMDVSAWTLPTDTEDAVVEFLKALTVNLKGVSWLWLPLGMPDRSTWLRIQTRLSR